MRDIRALELIKALEQQTNLPTHHIRFINNAKTYWASQSQTIRTATHAEHAGDMLNTYPELKNWSVFQAYIALTLAEGLIAIREFKWIEKFLPNELIWQDTVMNTLSNKDILFLSFLLDEGLRNLEVSNFINDVSRPISDITKNQNIYTDSMSPREWHKLKKNLVGMFICLLIFGTLAAVLVIGLQSSTVQEKCNDTHLANFPSTVQQAEAYCESVNGEFCTAPPPVIPFSSQEQQDCNPVTNCITLDPDSSQDIKYCCVDEQAGSSSDCTTSYMAFMNELMIMCNAYNDCYARSKNVFIGTILGGSFGAFILSMVAISTVINKKGKDLSNERINPITILFQRHDLAEFETWSNEALKSKDQKTLQVLFILSVLTRFNDASKKTLNLSMSETVSQASTFQRFVDMIRHAATINSRDTAEYETISDAPSPRIRLFRDSTIQ